MKVYLPPPIYILTIRQFFLEKILYISNEENIMINTVSFIQSTSQLHGKQKSSVQKKGSVTNESKSVNIDRFESSTSKSDKKMSGKLEYTEPTTMLFGLVTLRKGFYTYYPKKNETIADIKKKFNIKDDVIDDMNGIKDDDYCPAQNKIYEIYFRLDD